MATHTFAPRTHHRLPRPSVDPRNSFIDDAPTELLPEVLPRQSIHGIVSMEESQRHFAKSLERKHKETTQTIIRIVSEQMEKQTEKFRLVMQGFSSELGQAQDKFRLVMQGFSSELCQTQDVAKEVNVGKNELQAEMNKLKLDVERIRTSLEHVRVDNIVKDAANSFQERVQRAASSFQERVAISKDNLDQMTEKVKDDFDIALSKAKGCIGKMEQFHTSFQQLTLSHSDIAAFQAFAKSAKELNDLFKQEQSKDTFKEMTQNCQKIIRGLAGLTELVERPEQFKKIGTLLDRSESNLSQMAAESNAEIARKLTKSIESLDQKTSETEKEMKVMLDHLRNNTNNQLKDLISTAKDGARRWADHEVEKVQHWGTKEVEKVQAEYLAKLDGSLTKMASGVHSKAQEFEKEIQNIQHQLKATCDTLEKADFDKLIKDMNASVEKVSRGLDQVKTWGVRVAGGISTFIPSIVFLFTNVLPGQS